MSTPDSSNDPRPAARPATPAGGPTPPPAKPGGGLSLTGIGCLAIIVVPLVGFGIWLATGKPGSPEQVCVAHLEENYSGAFENPTVTNTVDNAIASDVTGRFDGGTFSCALSKDPLNVENAIIFPRGGDPIVITF